MRHKKNTGDKSKHSNIHNTSVSPKEQRETIKILSNSIIPTPPPTTQTSIPDEVRYNLTTTEYNSETSTHNSQHTKQRRNKAIRKHLQQQLQRRRNNNPITDGNDDDNKLNWFSHPIRLHDAWNEGKYNDSIRIGSINISGISDQNQWLDWEVVLATTHELQIDIMGLTEIGINFKNNTVNSSFIEATKKYDRHMYAQTSCSNQLLSTKKNAEAQSQ